MSARLWNDFEMAQVPLSFQRGEGAGVRAGDIDALSAFEGRSTESPLTLTLSPLRGEGTAIVRFLKLGCFVRDYSPTVFQHEILQARGLFPPVSR